MTRRLGLNSRRAMPTLVTIAEWDVTPVEYETVMTTPALQTA